MLPTISGEFGVVADPEIRFSQAGKAWLKIRGKAADRVKDTSGNWSDGDAMFIDIVVGYGAENLAESVVKGDTIIVIGKLKMREYDKNGEKHVAYSIYADSVGPSTRWGAAKTGKASEVTPKAASAVAVAAEILGAEQIDQIPF
jgi:single-strand DNA-binding protein